MNHNVKVTVYRWAGQKWFLRINGECLECDLVVGQVRNLLAAHPDWPVELEVKPWLTHLWEALRHRGWHPPIVLVDHRLLRQGTISTRAELDAAIRLALSLRKQRPVPRKAEDAGQHPCLHPARPGAKPCENDLSR